jgi:hypothetical protein
MIINNHYVGNYHNNKETRKKVTAVTIKNQKIKKTKKTK